MLRIEEQIEELVKKQKEREQNDIIVKAMQKMLTMIKEGTNESAVTWFDFGKAYHGNELELSLYTSFNSEYHEVNFKGVDEYEIFKKFLDYNAK